MRIEANFTIVLRGYDIAEVDATVQRVQEAMTSTSPIMRTSVREELRRSEFRIRLRGYDRQQVDQYLATAQAHLA